MGEAAQLHIELRLIADVGIIGLPNAGKTSLLNALTNAGGKVAPYAFTTLDPNLGSLNGVVLADIPGLIEGAAEGRGLGLKFLKHISRTRLLLHCVSVETPDPFREYETVRHEIQKFEKGALSDKRELIVLTKSDTRELAQCKEISAVFAARDKETIVVSILSESSIRELGKRIVSLVV
jgi:GTP-binding protein